MIGRYFVIGGGDLIILLWDIINWICVWIIMKMIGLVRSLSFMWDGSFVVGGSDDGKVFMRMVYCLVSVFFWDLDIVC